MGNPNQQSRYNTIATENKPILVYEELSSEGNPQKFYGKKVASISATNEQNMMGIQTEIPNYAFLIFDVRFFSKTNV